jgi:hypothetical protein
MGNIPRNIWNLSNPFLGKKYDFILKKSYSICFILPIENSRLDMFRHAKQKNLFEKLIRSIRISNPFFPFLPLFDKSNRVFSPKHTVRFLERVVRTTFIHMVKFFSIWYHMVVVATIWELMEVEKNFTMLKKGTKLFIFLYQKLG